MSSFRARLFIKKEHMTEPFQSACLSAHLPTRYTPFNEKESFVSSVTDQISKAE